MATQLLPARPLLAIACLLLGTALGGCLRNVQPIQPVAHVDLDRFMGRWYVIASIPTFLEKNAFNAVESYALRPDGRVQTTFSYRKGGFDGAPKVLHPIGTVRAGSGDAVWDMQFVWPISAEYVVAYLDAGYQQTIIARSARDHVWIMARTPRVPAEDYAALLRRVGELGYRVEDVREVPQRWPDAP
ncbi:MAG: hypothetical protein RL684_152 [Pseudomonadota bacterium]|jgi:apolipoprotein D and lipocalin family protein